MKVLHVISGGDTGGAKTSVIKLLKSFKDTDVEATLICFMKGVFYKEAMKHNLDCRLIEQRSRFDMHVVEEIVQMVEKDGYELINAHGARANFVMARLRGKVRVPIVTTIHSDYEHDFDHSKLKKLIFTTLNKRALKKMDAFITMAEDFKNIMVKRGFDQRVIHVAYNGVDESAVEITDTKEAFLSKYDIPYEDNALYIGIATRLHPVKGTDVFLEGAKAVLAKRQDIHFIIAGFGDYKYEQMYKSFVMDHGLQDNVHFIGFVNHIYDFYNTCDINVNSSHTEAVCFALLEGGILKKATIASRVGGTVELIEDRTHGLLFEDNDFEGLKKAVLELADDPYKRQMLGENLYQRISETFSVKAMGTRYQAIYQKIQQER